jgi:hypothetical protein
MFMLAPIAYRLDSLSGFHEQILKLDLQASEIDSVRCSSVGCSGCSAQYGCYFHLASLFQKNSHIDFIVQDLQFSCPEHLGKVLLA